MNCFFCKGAMTNSVTNHVVSLQNCIIIIKNVPCEMCEQCGETFFDDAVAMELEKIIQRVKEIVQDVAIFEYRKMAS